MFKDFSIFSRRNVKDILDVMMLQDSNSSDSDLEMALHDLLFFKKKHLPDVLIWKTSLTHAVKKCLGIRARLNQANINQHCWSNNVAQCWMRILNKVKADQTKLLASFDLTLKIICNMKIRITN